MDVKPILFSTQMVRAILEGRKSMTRRVVKPQPVSGQKMDGFWTHGSAAWSKGIKSLSPVPGHSLYNSMPYQPEDILWVRETWKNVNSSEYPAHFFRADNDCPSDFDSKPWRPSIFMPKSACRIWLKVNDVRIERLQEITEEDAIKEGFEKRKGLPSGVIIRSARSVFRELWDELSKSHGADWYTNEWVWVISFERCDKPEGW